MPTRARRLKYTLAGVVLLPIAIAVLVGVFLLGWIWGGWFVGGVDSVSAATGVPFTLLIFAIGLSMWWWSRRR